jgi:alkylation response protein AidB-like acyl-CoA dehydrogenase
MRRPLRDPDRPGSAPQLTCSGHWDSVLDHALLRQAAYLTGLCRGSPELAVTYARQRTLFGRSLAAHQAPAFRLAALAARREAVRSLIYRGERASQSLKLAAELAVDTAIETLQIHGASGLLNGSDAHSSIGAP